MLAPLLTFIPPLTLEPTAMQAKLPVFSGIHAEFPHWTTLIVDIADAAGVTGELLDQEKDHKLATAPVVPRIRSMVNLYVHEAAVRRYEAHLKAVSAFRLQLIAALDENTRETLTAKGVDGMRATSLGGVFAMVKATFGTLPPGQLANQFVVLQQPFEPAKTTFAKFLALQQRTHTVVQLANAPISEFQQYCYLRGAILHLPGLVRILDTYEMACPATADQRFQVLATYLKRGIDLNPERTLRPQEVPNLFAKAVSAASAGTPATKPQKGPYTPGWCWTHGFAGHDCKACTSPDRGHQMAATKDDMMGGNTAKYTDRYKRNNKTKTAQ